MFENKIAVVLGGTSGIGYATAREFVDRGAVTVIASRRADEELDERVRALGDSGGTAWGATCDVADRQSVAQLFTQVENKYGRVDIVVNSAGYHAPTPAFEPDAEQVDRLIAVNFLGGINVIQAAIQSMRPRGGVIVAVHSTQSVLGEPGQAVYAATKAGIAHFLKSTTPELRKTGIRLVGFAPGAVDTPMVAGVSRPTTPELAAMKSRLEAYDNSSPYGEFFLQPEEVAPVIAFLASDGAKAIHGVNVVGDQGRTSSLFGMPEYLSD
jgi:3-oxoacyl-[acyl-carrier protein] reductase